MYLCAYLAHISIETVPLKGACSHIRRLHAPIAEDSVPVFWAFDMFCRSQLEEAFEVD
jgi:hypothetical protein